MTTDNEQIFRIYVDYSSGREKLERVREDLKKAQSEVRKLNIAQQELNTGLKNGAVSEEEFRIKSAKNAQQMVVTTRSITALNEQKRLATLETKKWAVAETASKGSITEIQARLTALRMRYRELSGEQLKNKAVGGALLTQIQTLSAQYKRMEMSMGNTGVNVGNYAKWTKLQSTITSVATGVFGVQRLISDIFKPFKDFEYQMDKVSAVSGATADQFAALKKNARELGESTEYTAAQVAELQLAYSRLGFSPDEILEVTRATLDLATATGEDLARSADIAGATLRGFGLEAKEMPRVIDVMTESLNRSALDLNMFAESMKYVAPIAKTAGVSIEQTSAMLGILADRGIRGSQAGTALRRILTEISISGKTVSEALADLNQKGLTVAGAMDEVGRYAMTALTVLVENAPKVDVMTSALEHSAGAAQKAAAIMRDNLKGDVDQAISAMQEKVIAFGTSFEGVLRGLVQVFTTMVRHVETVTVAVVAYFVAVKAATAGTTLFGKAKRAAIVASRAEATATDVATLSHMRNLVALRNASAGTKLLAAVQLLLTGQFKAAAIAARIFIAAMASTGVGLIVAGIAAAVSYLVLFREKTDIAAESQKRINAAQEEFNRKQQERKDRSSELISTTRDENAAQLERVQAFRELQVLYPEILGNYTLESFLLADIAKIKQQLAQSDSNRKLVNDNKNLAESLERLNKLEREIYSRYHGGLNASKEFRFITTRDLEAELAQLEQTSNSFYRIVLRNQKDLEAAQPVEIRIASLDKNIEDLTAQITEMKRLAKENPWAFQSQYAFQSAQADLAAAGAQKNALTATVTTARSLKDEMKKLSDEQLEEKKSSGSKEEKEAAKQILKGRKAAEAAAKDAKEIAEDKAKAEQDAQDMILSIMKEGKEKELALQEKAFKENLKKANGDAGKEAAVVSWNKQRIQEIEDSYNTKSIEEAYKKSEFKISLMEEGEDRQRELLKIEYERKIAEAKKNGTDLLAVESWYEREKSKIQESTPQGERAKADAQADIDFQREIARIKGLEIAQKDKDQLEAQAVNDLEKTKILNHKAEIDRLYALGKITKTEYEKMSAGIGVDLAGNENKGNGIDDPENPKLKKTGSFFAKMFGFDPKDKKDRQEFRQKRKEAINMAVDTALAIGQAVIDIQTQISQRRLKLEQERIDAERNSELKSLELRYNKGLMSEKSYNKAVEATNAEADRKKEEAERAAFEREKRLKIMGVAIDTAVGITKVWSEAGLSTFKLGWAIAQTAFLTASGIAQTAVIASQQYAQGGIVPVGDGKNGVAMGMLQGPSHAQGGIPLMVNGQPVNAEVEGGEILAVINKRSAARYLPLFSAINATDGVKFESGGIVGSGWSLPQPVSLPPTSGQFIASLRDDLRTYYRQTEQMIKSTNSRVDNIKVHVVESDITKTQKNVTRIKAMATISGRK